MKTLLILFITLSSAIAGTSPQQSSQTGEVWIKFNASLGTTEIAVPEQGDLKKAQVVIREGEFCTGLNGPICAAKYTFDTNPLSTTAQLIKILSSNEYRFNPNYPGGASAAVEDREAEMRCSSDPK